MAKTISIVNLKGGVGKTAVAVNFAAFCGSKGFRTLLIDMDPQTNATFSCVSVERWKTHAREHGTVANLLGLRGHTRAENSTISIADVVIRGVFPGVDLIPSHLDLFTIDLDLSGATGREFKLRKAIEPIQEDYDIIVCDCPPNLTIPTQNALATSSYYLVPTSPDYLSALGIGILLNRVRRFGEDLDHEMELIGISICRVGRPARHRMDTIEALRDEFAELVLEQQITERVAVSESAYAQNSIFKHSDQVSADEFSRISHEILERLGESV